MQDRALPFILELAIIEYLKFAITEYVIPELSESVHYDTKDDVEHDHVDQYEREQAPDNVHHVQIVIRANERGNTNLVSKKLGAIATDRHPSVITTSTD